MSECCAVSSATLSRFEPMFRSQWSRPHCTVVRVSKRMWRYIRYHKYFRDIYGMGMYRRFYRNNLHVAIKNRLRTHSKPPLNP